MRFEGDDVDECKATIRLHRFHLDVPLMADEVVEFRVVVHVSEVTHRVDPRTGLLTRDHTLRLKEVELVREDGSDGEH